MSDLVEEMQQNLSELLDPYNHLSLECDGFTRVAVHLLNEQGIPHKCYCGSCTNVSVNFQVCPHFWIEVGDFVVDYRLILYSYKDDQGMRWRLEGSRPESQLADDVMEFPRGVFRKADYPDFRYQGEEIELSANEVIFQILTADGVTAKEQVVLENLRRAGL